MPEPTDRKMLDRKMARTPESPRERKWLAVRHLCYFIKIVDTNEQNTIELRIDNRGRNREQGTGNREQGIG
jgi:hypothetical protein